MSYERFFGGSAWTPAPFPEWQYSTCNCACSRCLAGSCCQFGPSLPTTVTTNTGPMTVLHTHRWVALGLDAGDVIQSCECGDVRRVEVPA